MIDYNKELNEQQLEVVKNGNGPCLVLAGAGSGKTRTITYRVAYLLEQGVDVSDILLLTFTNKAANEMIERIQKLTGMKTKLPYAGTFHSIANKILRHYAPVLNYDNSFTILDSDDSLSLIKLGIKQFKPDTDKKFPSAKVIQSIISYARNSETSLEDVLNLKHSHFLEFAPNITSIANEYIKQKKGSNSMDFDDLLVNFLLLLNRPEILEKFSNQFKYILVDEYQDTNKIQASIIRKLSLTHNNILVVGDDAQSIYSFRAADIKNILDFEKKYPQTKVYKLETNYRSSQEILSVANDVISNNIKQYKKELSTIIQSGIKPVLYPQMDQKEEARYIIKKIKHKIDKGVAKKEIAVLFRAAFHSQMLEMELVKNNIAYDYRGGLRFFDRAHIKDTLAYLRVFNNISDHTAWLRILLHEEGIGPTTAQKIIYHIKQVNNIDGIQDIVGGLSGKAKQGWNNFLQIWNRLIKVDKKDVAALVMLIRESSYQDYLAAEYTDFKDRLEDIEQLSVFAENTEALDDFLAEASLQENFNANLQAYNNQDNRDKIILSTIHQAKGLEWDTVFIINLASGAFPSDRVWQEREGIEEERRLFYVAITRAKRYLYLLYPMESNNWSSNGGPSLFLDEISTVFLDDRSILNSVSVVLDDDIEDVHYVDEYDNRPKISPGNFLIDV